MKAEKNKHTFVVCAYKESKHLESCILSLLNQTVKSRIIISTATPNEHITKIAEKYSLDLYINGGIKGITGDWNFGLSKAEARFVTIAHQDDFYEPNYAERVLNAAENGKPIIIFTDYFEIRNGERVTANKLLKIKRLMNRGFKLFPSSVFVRNRILSFGNPICCPAVTYCMDNCGEFRFDNNFKCACDWEAWSRLAKKKGSFIYIPEMLMGHRIYGGSTTTETIENGVR